MTSEIPSLGSGGEHTPATDPHGRGLGQKEKKEEPDHNRAKVVTPSQP